MIEFAVALDDLVTGVKAGGTGAAGFAHFGGKGRVRKEADERAGEEFSVAHGSDQASRPGNRMLVRAACDQLAAGSDICADAWNSSGESFQYNKRQALAKAGEQHDIDGGEQVIPLLRAEELHMIFQAKLAAEILAGGRVIRIFVEWPRDEKSRCRKLIHGKAGGAEQGFHVLYRDDPAKEAHSLPAPLTSWKDAAFGAQGAEIRGVDTVGNDLQLFGRRAEFDLECGVPAKKSGDAVCSVVGEAAEQFKKGNPDAAEQGGALEQAGTEHGGIVNPAGFLQIGDAFPDVNPVFAEQEDGVVMTRRQATDESGITGAETMMDTGGRHLQDGRHEPPDGFDKAAQRPEEIEERTFLRILVVKFLDKLPRAGIAPEFIECHGSGQLRDGF